MLLQREYENMGGCNHEKGKELMGGVYHIRTVGEFLRIVKKNRLLSI